MEINWHEAEKVHKLKKCVAYSYLWYLNMIATVLSIEYFEVAKDASGDADKCTKHQGPQFFFEN